MLLNNQVSITIIELILTKIIIIKNNIIDRLYSEGLVKHSTFFLRNVMNDDL